MSFNGIDVGLLRFCLQHSDGGNLPDSIPPPRDPKDYEWLRGALNDLQSDTQRMKACIDLLKQGEINSSQKEASLEDMLYYVEDVDVAADLHKCGGIPVLINLLHDENDEVKIGALWVIGTALQNNPVSQRAAFEGGALDAVLELISTQEGGQVVPVPASANSVNQRVREKALFTISGLIKDFPEALEEFLKRGGLYQLGLFLQHPKASIRMKAAFIITGLMRTKAGLISDVLNLNILAPVVAMVDDPDSDAREKAVSLLEILISSTSEVKKRCKEMQLPNIISERLKKLELEGSGDNEDYDHQISILRHLQQTLDS